MLMRANSAD